MLFSQTLILVIVICLAFPNMICQQLSHQAAASWDGLCNNVHALWGAFAGYGHVMCPASSAVTMDVPLHTCTYRSLIC